MGNHSGNCMDKNADIVKVTKTIFGMILVFSICVLPISIHIPIVVLTGRDCSPLLSCVTQYLTIVNSCCNFFIYNLRNESFREEFKNLLGLRSDVMSIKTTIKTLSSNDTSNEKSSKSYDFLSIIRKKKVMPEEESWTLNVLHSFLHSATIRYPEQVRWLKYVRYWLTFM